MDVADPPSLSRLSAVIPSIIPKPSFLVSSFVRLPSMTTFYDYLTETIMSWARPHREAAYRREDKSYFYLPWTADSATSQWGSPQPRAGRKEDEFVRNDSMADFYPIATGNVVERDQALEQLPRQLDALKQPKPNVDVDFWFPSRFPFQSAADTLYCWLSYLVKRLHVHIMSPLVPLTFVAYAFCWRWSISFGLGLVTLMYACGLLTRSCTRLLRGKVTSSMALYKAAVCSIFVQEAAVSSKHEYKQR